VKVRLHIGEAVALREKVRQSLRSGTASGFAAIGLWSTTVALARSLSEQLGPLTAAATVYGVSGLLAVVCLLLIRDTRHQIWRLPLKYLVGCGLLFVGYMLVLFLALGLAASREQALEVGLLNYLWPTLTILCSLLLLGNRAGWLLLPGTLLALSGVVLVLTQGADVSWRSFARNLGSNPIAYSLGLAAAVSWALYSTLTRRWADKDRGGAVDLFLPATGIILLLAAMFSHEQRIWSLRALAEAGFLGIVTYVAYGLWDTAMRRGNVVLVAAGSYLTAFLSTLVSCLYLTVATTPSLWVGCGLLVAGSFLSWLSVSERPPLPSPTRADPSFSETSPHSPRDIKN
jgi:drug/metabolite transporter (DMT)-like permease